MTGRVPALRGQARQILEFGECQPWQGCPFVGGCETCSTAEQPSPARTVTSEGEGS